MSKLKFLSIAVVGLLVINLILLGFIFFSKPKQPNRMGPRNIIIEKLEFNDDQVKKYDDLIKWHREEITKSEHDIMQLKNQLYNTLNDDSVTTRKDSLINELSKVQVKIEHIHYKHFRDIKELCSGNQKKLFINLTQEIGRLFAPPPIKGKK